jgi:hypothetical protein
MSRTLRRPMFRGGSVNSRGTGITSGLDDSGYADGGNVVPKRGLVDGPGGYAGDFNYSRDTGLGRFMPKFNEYVFREPLAAAYNLVGVPLNKATEFVTGYNPGFSGERLFNLDMKNRKPDTAEFFGMDTGAKRGFTYQNESEQKIEDQKLKDTTLKDDYEKKMQKLKDDYEKRIEGLKGAVSPDLTDEEQITKQAELYQKLLGGDEAKSQAVYDALLAASPAFFKGKNLREAAPEVLTAINKSGAFDKPRDIKQAAAQLAIQRNILRDKAIAEEKSRLAIYGAKNVETLSETLKNIPGSFIAGPLPKGSETNPNLLRPGGIYSVGNEKFYAVPGEVIDSSGKKKQGVVGLQKL